MTSAVERYGGWKLQIGDSDRTRQWGGAVRGEAVQATGQAAPGGHMVTVSSGRFVEQLKEDLETLGFSYFDVVDGEFDVFTECALREFQVYARMPRVARDASVTLQKPTYYENLEPVENAKRYGGPASGVLNPETATLILHWLWNQWRCPIVVLATLDTDEKPKPKGAKRGPPIPEKDVRINHIVYENVWRYDQFTSGRKPLVPARYWVHDVTGYYELPPTRAAAANAGAQREHKLRKIGRYLLDNGDHKHFGGAETRKVQDSWWETEVSPEELYSKRWEDMSEDERQSFLVYRTVSDQECLGRFDMLNFWDRAIVSFGLCHITFFGLKKNQMSLTQFATGSGADFLLMLDEALRSKYFSAFGLRVHPKKKRFCLEGDDAGPGGDDQKGWVILDVPGKLGAMPKGELQLLENRVHFLKSWHWAHRLQMALRSDPRMRIATARFFAKQYLDKWRACKWDEGVARVKGPPERDATLGDVFRSPYLVGFLSRRYVNLPGDICSSKKPHELPKKILAKAKETFDDPKWNEDPLSWPSEFQEHLEASVPVVIQELSGAKTRERLQDGWAKYVKWRYRSPTGNVQLSKQTFLSFKYISAD